MHRGGIQNCLVLTNGESAGYTFLRFAGLIVAQRPHHAYRYGPASFPCCGFAPEAIAFIEIARSALADYAEQPGDPKVWQALLSARRSAAKAIAGLPPAQRAAKICRGARIAPGILRLGCGRLCGDSGGPRPGPELCAARLARTFGGHAAGSGLAMARSATLG